ncbi:MAG: class II aldolase/adducin family protein [Oscillibacter sp.]|nr:class II aldolase/adducin family protein [Oscillibacter sp.]
MNYKAELVAAGKQMLEKKLTVETWGNISLYDAESGLVYMTPSAMAYHTIVEDDVVVVRLSDGEVVEGKRKPTIEKELHLEVYRNRPGIGAVIHTHPIHSQVFAALHQSIPAVIDEAAQALGGEVVTAEYALPGSQELADNTIKALGQDKMACLLANHGAVCIGEDLGKAFKTCAVLEMTAQIYQMALQIGTPHIIPEDKVAFMRDYVKNHYGQGK